MNEPQKLSILPFALACAVDDPEYTEGQAIDLNTGGSDGWNK